MGKSRARSLDLPAALAADRARVLNLGVVSRETAERLDRFVELLLTWQRATHLIAPSTLPNLWTRHILDSLQLLALAGDARRWVDVGTGGGFPGLVIACALAGVPGAVVHLVESNAKKAAFLREACRVTDAPARVHRERMEDFAVRFQNGLQIVTARAVAPLKSLLNLCFPLLADSRAMALFPKGRSAEAELAEAAAAFTMNAQLVPSRTDPMGRILVIRDLARAR
jgi:16S rRNA (guanine527-N7)-methyltransferase